NNTCEPGIELASVDPAISPEAAALTARERIAGLEGAASVTSVSTALGVHAGGFLAWQVTLETDGGPTWELLVDARAGTARGIPLDINLYGKATPPPPSYTATGRGQVFNPNPVVVLQDPTLRDQDGAASAVPAAAYSMVNLEHLDAALTTLDGKFATTQ